LTAGYLFENMLLFRRLLHQTGIKTSSENWQALFQSLKHIDLSKKMDFYHSIRCILIHHPEDYPRFDHAFNLFWQNPTLQQKRSSNRQSLIQSLDQKRAGTSIASISGDTHVTPEFPTDALVPSNNNFAHIFSPDEVLRNKDFASLNPHEYAQVIAYLPKIIKRLHRFPTRRWLPRAGNRINLRRTIRRSTQYGGDILFLEKDRRKTRLSPLIILVDISGSMENYTQVLLHFFHALTIHTNTRVETFVFSTQITRITQQLSQKNIAAALRAVSGHVTDWAGGTRIGESLSHYNDGWARRFSAGRPTIIVVSDGWDRGSPDLFRHEVARLQRSCRRLLWLNPLLSTPEYQPLTRGLQSALPFIDEFLPVSNLASLDGLLNFLAEMDRHRPFRTLRSSPQSANIHA